MRDIIISSTLTIIVLIAAGHVLGGAFWLLNQASSLANLGGAALLPSIAGGTFWAITKIWRL